jgi:hypothetical protein
MTIKVLQELLRNEKKKVNKTMKLGKFVIERYGISTKY